MSEAPAPGADPKPEVTPAGPAPAPKAEDSQAKNNADAAAARKAFEAEKAKLVAEHEKALNDWKAKYQEASKNFSTEREWRMIVLDKRAEAAGVTETVSGLAKEKGPAAYESVIAEFEQVKAKAAPAATPAKPEPVEQPGGEVGGSSGINLNLDMIDPTTNPNGMAAAHKAYKEACGQYTQGVVDAALAKRAAQRK